MDILQRQWVLYGSYFPCKSKVYRRVLGIKIREYPRAERSRRCGMSRFPHWYSIHIVEPGVVTHNLPAAQLRLPPAVQPYIHHQHTPPVLSSSWVPGFSVEMYLIYLSSQGLSPNFAKNSLNIISVVVHQ